MESPITTAAAVYSNVRIAQDEQGDWCYPGTQRTDGSWRKSVKIRPGYSPNEAYVIPPLRKPHNGTAQDKVAEEVEPTTSDKMNPVPGSASVSDADSKKIYSLPKLNLFLHHCLPKTPEKVANRDLDSASKGRNHEVRRGIKISSTDILHVEASQTENGQCEPVRHKFNLESQTDETGTSSLLHQQSVKVDEKMPLRDESFAELGIDSFNLNLMYEDFMQKLRAGELSKRERVMKWNHLVGKAGVVMRQPAN